MTRVFTPRSRSVDIAAITAAPPDMSVFIVSMPPAVLIDRPPESNTTPLPTSASVCLRAGAARTRAARSAAAARNPCRRRARRRAAPARAARPSNTSTFSPFAARDAAARARRPSSGDFAAGGLVDQVARPRDRLRDPRAAVERRRAPSRSPRPSTTTCAASTASRPTCTRGTGSARARRPRRTPARPPRVDRRRAPRRAASSRPSRPSPRGGRAPRPPGATRRRRASSRVADADEDRGLGAEPPPRRHRERLAALALEAGLGHELGEAAAERVVDHVGAGAELGAPRTRDGEQVGAHLVGGGTTGFDRERHGSGVYGFREKYPTA